MELGTKGLQPLMLTPRVPERYRQVTWAIDHGLTGFGVPALAITFSATARTGPARQLAGDISAKRGLHPFSTERERAGMPFASS